MNKPVLSWMKQLGTSGEDKISDLATDAEGNVFIAGYTSGEMAAGQQMGKRDAYLAKYDSAGTRQWDLQFGTMGYDAATALATDANGNVYIAGHTSGYLASGRQKTGLNAFLAKCDAKGNKQWVQQFGTSGHDEAFALATDVDDNVFIAGYVSGELATGQHKGGMDAFLAKYDSSGNRQWVQQLGTTESDSATAIVTDIRGNVFIAGHTKGELVAGQRKGNRDAFLAKYSGSGNRQWVQQLGTPNYDAATALATDNEGNVFLAANTSGELVTGQHKGGRDAYLAKYDGDGTCIWDVQMGTAGHDEATALATDKHGNVYLAGQTSGEMVAGQHKGGLDAYLTKYDGGGTQLWQLQLGSSDYDYATALATDAQGNVFIAGNTDGEMVAGEQSGGWDAFLAKYAEADV